MGSLLLILGSILLIGGGIWLLVVAFQESLLWGLGCLLIPFVSLVFVIMNWSESKNPFLVQIAGLVLCVLGVVISAPSAPPAG